MRALDHKTKTHVAIKVIRNDKAYTQQAAIEVYNRWGKNMRACVSETMYWNGYEFIFLLFYKF